MEIVNFPGLADEIIYTIIILLITFILVRIVKNIKKLKRLSLLDENLVRLINDLIRYLIYIGALVAIFEVFGIDLTSVFLSLGILGITVGFAAKDLLSNFVSGIFIISDKNINVGDTIETDGIKGKIEKISFRTTTLIDQKGVYSVIPNSILSNQAYYKFKKLEDLKVDINVTIPLNTDFEKIINTIKNIEEINKKKSPEIVIDNISPMGISLKISVWINDSSNIDNVKLKITDEIRLLLNNQLE